MNYWKIIKEVKFIQETLNLAHRKHEIDIDIKDDIETSLSTIVYEIISSTPTDVLKEGGDNEDT